MRISKQTLDILKNFSTISPSIIIEPGDSIATMSMNRDIVAYAKSDEEFEKQLAIYDLNELIATLNLFSEPDIKLEDTSMTISDNSSRCTYGYADPDIIAAPPSQIKFPGADVEFTLSRDVLDRIMRASSTLGLANIVVTKKNNDIVIEATDIKNVNSNAFSIVVGRDESENKYKLVIPAANLKLIRDDYQVKISKRLISEFEGSQAKYYLALEKTSTFE